MSAAAWHRFGVPLWMGLALAIAVGCGAKPPVPPPSPAPELAEPSRALPADLDVALRVDLAAFREVLGIEAIDALQLELTDREKDPEVSRLLQIALAHADTMWVAFRPGLASEYTDNVVVLQGSFGEVQVRDVGRIDNPWAAPVDLGADLRRYDRPSPLRRSAPARIYAHSDTLLVFVSEAEIDSVERRIEERANDARIEPPEQGTVSITARVQPLLPHLDARYPAVVELLAEGKEVRGHATFRLEAITATLEADLGDEAEAKRAAEAAESLRAEVAGLGVPLGLIATNVTIRPDGKRLVMELGLNEEQTTELLGCVIGGATCSRR